MSKKRKKRGVLLTIWLLFVLISNLGIALLYLLIPQGIMSANLYIPFDLTYVYGILALANFMFAIYLFQWKKWAFFALCGSAIAAFILNLIVGVALGMSMIGLSGPVILYLILKPRWKLLE